MILYVDGSRRGHGDGSAAHPYRTISDAARAAFPGDEIVVAPGVYRETVQPERAGTETARIVYRSAEPGGAVITGAEPVGDWEPLGDGVWTARVANALFGEYNPYTTLVSGDWFIAGFLAHTGEVYLNDKSLYESDSLEGVRHPQKSKLSWDPEFSVYTWYTEQDEARDETVLYANFHEYDPNRENVEINVRRNCFFPAREHVDYITLSGFTVRQAATQWAPPTAFQDGMVGPHWAKGWIIEDCEISHSKCSGISLGKYLQPENDNKWLKWKRKDGTQTERDCICQAQWEGWSKETIGSHIVRRCHIHDCGQTGIVGHLGGVFSLIEENHIHHINNKHNLAGAEIGGIKMHAAIDVIFRRNHIHHCTRGLWLDWQAQGTRVTQNVFHDNCLPNDYNANLENSVGVGEDLFVEVSHGPTLVDNNLLLSDHAIKCCSQGLAFVHNLIAGSITAVGKGVNNGSVTLPSPRFTPYHRIHRTEVAGFMTILHGDMRFYNNIFVQRPVRPGIKAFEDLYSTYEDQWTDHNTTVGTKPYNGYMTEEEFDAMFEGYCGMGSPATDRYYLPLPVWTGGNLFVNGAVPCDKERDFTVAEKPVTLSWEETEGGCRLVTNLAEVIPAASCSLIRTEALGMAFEPEERFENPDGSPIVFTEDICGRTRGTRVVPGPFADPADIGEVLPGV